MENETPQQMMYRVWSLFTIEEQFNTSAHSIQKLKNDLISDVQERKIISGSPLLTNAGRNDLPLSSCVVVPVDYMALENNKIGKLEKIKSYFKQNMGAGLDLTNYNDCGKVLNNIKELSKSDFF